MNDPFIYNFLAAMIVNNLYYNPVLFKSVGKKFLIDIMMHNQHRHNSN